MILYGKPGTGKTLTAFSLILKLKERINNELGFKIVLGSTGIYSSNQ